MRFASLAFTAGESVALRSRPCRFVGDTPLAKVRAAVEQELAATDLAFSQWRSDSEIARVHAHRSTEPVPLSPRFAALPDHGQAAVVCTQR